MAPSNHPLTQRALNDRQVADMKRLLARRTTEPAWVSMKWHPSAV